MKKVLNRILENSEGYQKYFCHMTKKNKKEKALDLSSMNTQMML